MTRIAAKIYQSARMFSHRVHETNKDRSYMKSVQIVSNGAIEKRVQVQTELTAEELHERYRQNQDAVERTHWHIVWQIKEGKSPRQGAELIGYTARWVRTRVQRWNAKARSRHPRASS